MLLGDPHFRYTKKYADNSALYCSRLNKATQNSKRPVTVESNLNISEGAIVIHAGDKADAREIARQVEQALERIERKRAAENRSKLRDLD